MTRAHELAQTITPHLNRAESFRAASASGAWQALAELERLADDAEHLRDALEPLRAQAQDILDVLASGSEPYASTGYGYEHMGDYTRDVKPLCEALAALKAAE